MRKTKFKVGALVAAAALAVSSIVPVFAATSYTAVTGTSCNFNKYLIMDVGDSVPNATFSFTVAPGTAVSPDTSSNDVMEIMAGVGTPTIADVTFAPGDATATSAGTNIDVARAASDRQSGLTAANGVQLEAGEKYATKQATVDFSSVSFNEPGIYRYIVTETANASHEAAGIMHDNDTDRVLDVYVIDNNGTLEVASYVLHTNVSDPVIGTDMGSADVASTGTALSDKTDGFTNEYNTKDLRFSKEVAGNQGARDKYFELTVTATNVADNDSFVVSLADDSDANTNDGSADATSGAAKIGGTIAANAGKTNPTTVTGTQLKAGQKFYLQHGQNIVIRGLPLNASYTLTENAEDYKSAVMSGKTNSGVIGTVAGNAKVAEAGFTNTRGGTIPTGVAVYAGVGVAMVVIAAATFVLTRKNKGVFH